MVTTKLSIAIKRYINIRSVPRGPVRLCRWDQYVSLDIQILSKRVLFSELIQVTKFFFNKTLTSNKNLCTLSEKDCTKPSCHQKQSLYKKICRKPHLKNVSRHWDALINSTHLIKQCVPSDKSDHYWVYVFWVERFH